MAEWRDRGFVADSDDEDEAIASNDTQNPRLIDPSFDDDFRDIEDLEDDGSNETTVTSTAIDIPVDQEEDTYPKEAKASILHGTVSNIQSARDNIEASKALVQTFESEDDIDELQQDHYGASAAAQIEAELNYEVYRAEERVQQADGYDTVLSSPLTEPASTPSFLSQEECRTVSTTSSSLAAAISKAPEAQHSTSGKHGEGDTRVSQNNETVGEYAPLRALRQRNPIQLHPYAVESERYRQTLKARGVKPLRIGQGQTETRVDEDGEEDSQEREFNTVEEEEFVTDKNDVQDHIRPAPSVRVVVPATTAHHHSNAFTVDGDDLPDVDALLRHSPMDVSVQGYKRRKIVHTFSKRPRMLSTKSDQIRSARSDAHRDKNGLSPDGFDSDHIYDVPCSPPPSGSSASPGLSETNNQGFRFPLGFSPPQPLQTPATSSESGKRALLPPLETTDSEEESIDTDQNGESQKSQGTTEPQSSDSENEVYHQLERVQRKIRGVLPASWLKLDMKTHVKKPDKRAVTDFHRVSPIKIGMERGVARPVSRSKGWSPSATKEEEKVIVLSDGSVSEDEVPGAFAEQAGRMNGLRDDDDTDLPMLDPWGDLEEDNRIDAMLPTATRTTGPSGSKKTRQPRLTNGNGAGRQRPTDRGLFKKSNGSHSHQPRITDHLGRRKVPALKPAKFRPPRLSILDAPTSPIRKPDVVPNFLRLAARTVRSRKDKGRHSPSRKFIRLGTREDTEDACETLHNWREGTFAPAVGILDSHSERNQLKRGPLSIRSGNEGGPARKVTQPEQGWKESILRVDSGKTRQIHRDNHGKGRQTLLDHIKQRKIVAASSTLGQGNKAIPRIRWKKNGLGQGQLTTSLQSAGASRPAMLESLQVVNDHDHPQAAFQRNMSRINHKRSTQGAPNVLLARFLEDEDASGLPEPTDSISNNERDKVLEAVTRLKPERAIPHRARKRRPRHVDIQQPLYRQLSVPIVIEDDSAAPLADTSQEQTVLYGLGPFSTRYTTTFDITALPSGTFFHGDTLVGSGEFSKSLALPLHRDMDQEAGSMSFTFEQDVYEWGSWNETVSSQLGLLFDGISHGFHTAQSGESTTANQNDKVHGTHTAMESFIRYINDYISFLDPVDRTSCLQRCRSLVGGLLNELEDDPRDGLSTQGTEELQALEMMRVKIATYSLVMINQLSQIAQHELVASSLVSEFEDLISSTARCILTGIIRGIGLREIRRSLDNMGFHGAYDVGIRGDVYRIEALLVVYHIFKQKYDTSGAFWEHLRKCGFAAHVKSSDARLLDCIWHDLFTLLPLLELDAQGVMKADRRFENATENWALVQELTSHVLQTYLSNPCGQLPTFNTYCRALLGRCFILIKIWGWSRCETIIGTMFDFFARNGLCHLRNEESHGSPRFLEHLDQDQNLDLEREERAFHIFLKVTGVGLQQMRKIYPNKRIRDIVWRLMPNHGRQHPKDEAIRKYDLDALRNHHDLLCILYWGSPPGVRPRLDAIRNLVHLESSHREACHINIKAWSNLVRFQLSVDEPLASLEPFADWYRELWTQSLRQHGLARTEAEAQFRSATLAGYQVITKEALESTIARNQRQVEAILVDALLSLKSAILAARSAAAAQVLLTPSLSDVFCLFHAKQTRFNMVMMQALDVVLCFTQKCILVQRQERSQAGNEDSQEYGDWSAFEDNEEDQLRRAAAVHLHESIHKPLSHLLSNLFGAEVVPDDGILLKTIDTWVAIAQVLVGQGVKSWDHYVSQYGQDSWSSLRNTEQTRKCAAYFLSTVIEKEPDCYRDHKSFFLTCWITSLVERESLLKFQYRYTAAILNADLGEPILKNLPFWTDKTTGLFEVSAQDFRERRVSLIFCLLSNIRQSLGEASYYQLSHASQLKQEYRDHLKRLMAVMKKNYQELGDVSIVRSAYVTFVQQVVQYMQQHTADICPIDQFFIDSTAFPLPATDPTYVVGRLKNYGLRLQEPGTPKKLAMFIQAVSERAAVDGQQLYLIDQLHVAMSDSFEDGDAARPTLRAFLVQAVFPAYIELAFSTSSGWILADPILQALCRVFERLLEDVDGLNKASVASIISTFTVLFASMQTSMELLVDYSGLLEQPMTLRTLKTSFSMITSALPSVDYMVGLSKSAENLVPYIMFFKSFALFAAATILGYEDTPSPYMDTSVDEAAGLAYAEIRQFALNELRETLRKNWTFHDGRYYLVRGNIRKEVVVELGIREEKAQFLGQIEDFVEALENMPNLGEEEHRHVVIKQRRRIGIDEAYF